MSKRRTKIPTAIAESIAELSQAIDSAMPPAEPINHDAWLEQQRVEHDRANSKARKRHDRFLRTRIHNNWKRY